MSEEYDERCQNAEEDIMEISDKYEDIISEITIKWKTENEIKQGEHK